MLAGLSWSQNKVRTTGFETIGWTNANLSATQSSATNRNSTGGGNWTIPGAVPANVASGITPQAAAILAAAAASGRPANEQINEAVLLQLNPGANIGQLDNGLIPRLGREMEAEGSRDRVNGILSVEWRPTEALDLYLDTVVGKKHNKIERTDMNWVGRNGSMVPVDLQFDRSDCSNGCVVTRGTFANAQWFLEYRPYDEQTTFYSNWGKQVAIAAPGGNTREAPTGGVLQNTRYQGKDDYYFFMGTSMASPHVAGVAALIRSAHKGMPQGAVAALIRSSATPMSCPASWPASSPRRAGNARRVAGRGPEVTSPSRMGGSSPIRRAR